MLLNETLLCSSVISVPALLRFLYLKTASICSPYLHLVSRLPAVGYRCPSRLQLLSLQRQSPAFFLIWIWDLVYDASQTSGNSLNSEVVQPLLTALITQTGMKAVFPTNFNAQVTRARSSLGVLFSSDKDENSQRLGAW